MADDGRNLTSSRALSAAGAVLVLVVGAVGGTVWQSSRETEVMSAVQQEQIAQLQNMMTLLDEAVEGRKAAIAALERIEAQSDTEHAAEMKAMQDVIDALTRIGDIGREIESEIGKQTVAPK